MNNHQTFFFLLSLFHLRSLFLFLRLIIAYVPFLYLFHQVLIIFQLQFLSLPECLLILFNHLLLVLNLFLNFSNFSSNCLCCFKISCFWSLICFNYSSSFFFLLFILFQFLLIFFNLFFDFCDLLLVSNNFGLNCFIPTANLFFLLLF